MVRTRLKRNRNLIPGAPQTDIPLHGAEEEAARRGLKVMLQPLSRLTQEGRDDFDYYEPTEELKSFPEATLKPLDEVVDFGSENRNPADDDRAAFKYVEISAIDTETGEIKEAIEIPCEEDLVPDRARVVIHAGDILISTVRPTRRAIARVPDHLDNEICSTGFAVVRPKPGVNPDYLLYVLRSKVVATQFGKFASGSSYPAITDHHIRMTLVPLPDIRTQETIAEGMRGALDRVSSLRREAHATLESFEQNAHRLLERASPGQVVEPQTRLDVAVGPPKRGRSGRRAVG